MGYISDECSEDDDSGDVEDDTGEAVEIEELRSKIFTDDVNFLDKE